MFQERGRFRVSDNGGTIASIVFDGDASAEAERAAKMTGLGHLNRQQSSDRFPSGAWWWNVTRKFECARLAGILYGEDLGDKQPYFDLWVVAVDDLVNKRRWHAKVVAEEMRLVHVVQTPVQRCTEGKRSA